MKKDKSKRQSKQYDKIFKENIEAVIPSLMQKILGITAIDSEELPDAIQHTKEREPDVLKKITDVEGNTFILQIEFQVVDEPKMIYRMGDYYFMLAQKYEIPVRQYVIFIGSGKPAMPTTYKSESMKFEFPLILFSEFDYHIFMKSNKPEEIVFGILANFEEENAQNAIKQIIQRLEETSDGDLALQKYFNQLRILAQLRNLEQKLKETIMDNIAKYIDEKRDVAYLVGIDKGIESASEKFVSYLLVEANRTLDQIADIAGVSVEFVRIVKQKLSVKK